MNLNLLEGPDGDLVLRRIIEQMYPELPDSFNCHISSDPHQRGFLLRIWFMPDFTQSLMLGDARIRAMTCQIGRVMFERSDYFLEELRMAIQMAVSRLFNVDHREAVEVTKKWKKGEDTTAIKIKRVVECGHCGASVAPDARRCSHCNYYFE